ncbi:oligoendopeptidase F [Alicyclobacillus fastidiosus]|uniref:Oligopeptidase F n=1 Tax=Alicyclobacillus fastidiosus TaxID=392011 RepID=A0ABV5ABY6_9BACL|nr:oligoendopeptidase F [Alicyclobacillus fastidiosus]WEH10341.1 oligoendopeptidase F [Alicyclobacillus fastidiosus]
MPDRLTRSQVPVELTWNLADLFASDETWSDEVESILSTVDTVATFQGRLGESAKVLLACLEASERLAGRIVRACTYASLRQSEDSTNPVNQAMADRAAAMVARIQAATSFIEAEVTGLDDGVVETWIEQEEGLKEHAVSLREMLDFKPYRLSPETESTLAALGQVFGGPYVTYQRSKLSDMQFAPAQDEHGAEHPVSFALYEDIYEFATDTQLRRNAYRSFANTLHQYKNTFASAYATEVNRQVTLARLRGFPSTTDMLLHPQQVTSEMYNNQLDIIQAELAPHMRRLARLRKRLFKLDTMLYCDLKIPLDSAFNPSTSIESATQLILDALAVMGPEYVANIRTALASRWVDYADNVGKSTGAFCSSPYGAHPYILITWGETMRSAFVLAHELGHAGHFALANQYQRLTNTRPSLYFIEAPSTMNEMLLADHVLNQTSDPRMRHWVISQLLGTYYHNFVTHLLEGELQRRIYRLADAGASITAKLLCEQKADVLTSFWRDTVDIDEGASLTWMRQPHYYMGLYPYTYSAGLTAATAVAKRIREEGPAAAAQWVEVLKAGGTKTPLELMQMAGVDLSTSQPISEAVAYVGGLIDKLEASFADELQVNA